MGRCIGSGSVGQPLGSASVVEGSIQHATGGSAAVGFDLVRQDALDVLRNALTWELPAQRWESVGRAVVELADALAADDEEAIGEAVLNLEQSGPVRGPRSMEGASAPSEVRSRIVPLVDHLERSSARDQTTEAASSPSSDDASG